MKEKGFRNVTVFYIVSCVFRPEKKVGELENSNYFLQTSDLGQKKTKHKISGPPLNLVILTHVLAIISIQLNKFDNSTSPWFLSGQNT